MSKIISTLISFFSVTTFAYGQLNPIVVKFKYQIDSLFYVANIDKELNVEIREFDTTFLFEKITNGAEWEKLKAIFWLGLKGNDESVEILGRLLSNPLYKDNRYGIVSSLMYANNKMSIPYINHFLDENDSVPDFLILKALKNYTSPSSVGFIDQYIRKKESIRTTKNEKKTQYSILKAKEVARFISEYNSSKEEIALKILLKSKNENEVFWALNKISRLNNNNYISLLKEVMKESFLNVENTSLIQRKVFKIRKILGDNTFTNDEKKEMKRYYID